MAYKCAIKFGEGMMPLGVKSKNIEELKKKISAIRGFSDLLVGLGCKGIDVEVYDMGVVEGEPERERYGISCQTYNGGKGCETCILNDIKHRAEKLNVFYTDSAMKSDIFSVLDEWAQSPQTKL